MEETTGGESFEIVGKLLICKQQKGVEETII